MWLILCQKMLFRELKNVQMHDATMVVAALLLTQLSSAPVSSFLFVTDLMKRPSPSERLDTKQTPLAA